MASGIYQITNQVSGKRYIGSSVNLRKRWWTHLWYLCHSQHPNHHLQAAFDKYGKGAFIFEVLKEAEPENLIEREQFYLDTLNPEYNISPTAGSTLGVRYTDEARARMSGERHHFYGKSLTKEHRRKLSEAMTGKRNSFYGRHHSTATIQKISKARTGERNPLYGRHLSQETKQKISKALLGRRLSAETKQKISIAHKGMRHSIEAKQKMSEAHKGKHHSVETKQKMSDARTEYWRKIHATMSTNLDSPNTKQSI